MTEPRDRVTDSHTDTVQSLEESLRGCSRDETSAPPAYFKG